MIDTLLIKQMGYVGSSTLEVVMSVLEEFLGIRRTVALWQNRVDAHLGAVHGLGMSDFAALHHLAAAPGGRLRRVDLAQRLERRGLVTREADGRDARATYAVLTKSGKGLAKDATATVTSLAESILGSLGERDRAAFAKLAAL
jgi:hypothetical protein